MPRAIWSGSISFGLVNVPVKVFPATQQKDVRFNQFEKGTGKRIHYRRVAEGTDHEVDYDDIVKGYEVSKGRFVMVTPEELEAVEPGQSRTIDIEDFVDLADIDPIHYEHTYYLVPDEGSGAAKAYALLREAMDEAGKVAIARFVMRTKQYLAAIRPSGRLLVLETMYFPDEVRDAGDLGGVPGKVQLTERERQVARRLVESLSTEWDPDRYADTYRERVLDLIDRKAKGEEVVVDDRAEPVADVTDLLGALEASIEVARKRRADGAGGGSRGAASPAGGRGRSAAPHRSRGSKEDGEAAGLASASKQELYEEAKKRDIPGRSDMSKDELIEALDRAS